jgi:hypothetical protein
MIKILLFLCDLAVHRDKVLVSGISFVLWLVYRIIKRRRGGKYVKRELCKNLKPSWDIV